MKITQHVRDYAASHGFSETEALEKGMEEKAAEFVKTGAEINRSLEAYSRAARNLQYFFY